MLLNTTHHPSFSDKISLRNNQKILIKNTQMLKKILFVTSNKGKVLSLQNRLPIEKFLIIQKQIELVEPQGFSSEEVSIAKAKQAFTQLEQPLVVQDSSLHITALNGFPGIYIKYIQESIGLEGLLKLMDGVQDRSCYFNLSLTYIEGHEKFKVFNKKGTLDKIATSIDKTKSEKAWGEIWKLYIPHWSNKPLSAISKEEIDEYETKEKDNSEFAQFAEWLNKGMQW